MVNTNNEINIGLALFEILKLLENPCIASKLH